MQIITPCYEVEDPAPLTHESYKRILRNIELAGRTAYKSEDKITVDSAERFVRMIVKRGHESVLEHGFLRIRFICDRGVTHELVRHRLVAYTQESTRYCNYAGKGITVIEPFFWPADSYKREVWRETMITIEAAYNLLIETGATPQEARSVLPNSLKTEIVCTANIREWRHILKLRTSEAAHPQMKEIMVPLLQELKEWAPVLFEDIGGL